MKKRFAIIANGWNNSNLSQAIKGIKSCTDCLNIDLFVFLSFAAFSQSPERNNGENSIYKLINYQDFDGIIIFSQMLDNLDTSVRLGKIIAESKVPAISVGMDIEGLDSVGIENFQGMYSLTEHLINVHHIKNPVFLAGPRTHPDSNERLDAVKYALKDNNIDLPDDRIFYTDWEYLKGIKYAQELAKSDNPPDAYICANDNIALAVCIGLERINLKVPQDAIVTGFDKLSYAETFYPSLTTVYQDYEKIGYVAAWQLIEKIEGTATTNKIAVTSEYLCNESCGCKKSSDAEDVRHKFCQDAYAHEMEDIIFQIQTSNIAQVLFECSTFNECKEKLTDLYSKDHSYEGSPFYICIDDNAYKSFSNSSFKLKKDYGKKMHCIVAIEDDKHVDYKFFPREKLLPFYDENRAATLYTFTSLHFDDSLFGYLVTTNNETRIKDTTLHHYMLQLNSNLEKYRQNCQLEQMNQALKEISIRDQLTLLYNRYGMQQKGVPLFEKAKQNGKKCGIVFTDINKMKFINDNYGHLNGDLAIKTVSSSVMNVMPENWICIRYGGDEFIAIGECKDEKFLQKLKDKILKDLEQHVKTMCLAYPLKASVGYIITDPDSNKSLARYIEEADNYMYEQKQKAHKKEAEQK